MNTQLWTLVGVVVGALLGGVAQVVALLLEHRATRVSAHQEALRASYADLVTAVRDHESLYIRVSTKVGLMQGNEVMPDWFTPAWTETQATASRALSLIQLLGPADSYMAARDTWNEAVAVGAHVMTFVGTGKYADMDTTKVVAASAALAIKVKRDLSI